MKAMPQSPDIKVATDIGVEAEAIVGQRGGRPIFEGLSFAAHWGDFLVFCGPNGVGKTTLLYTLIGLSGLVDGHLSISHDDCLFLGHDDGLKGELTVAQNLTFWIGVFGGQIPNSDQWPFDIGTILHQEVRHLSSGQRQKVALASVIFGGRRIWILDEPTTGLDAASSAEFYQLAQKHCDKSGIVIATTHTAFKYKRGQTLDLASFAITR